LQVGFKRGDFGKQFQVFVLLMVWVYSGGL
jgi:hypothetical protein